MGYGARIAFGALRGFGTRLCLLVVAAVIVCAGAVFPAQAQVKQTLVWSFSGGSDGNSPIGGVIADEKGALYGTTQAGGAFLALPLCNFIGCGVVFKLTPPSAGGPSGWTNTTLWSFSGGSGGDTPFAGLFARNESPSTKKSLYGTTSGFDSSNGTIFKLTDGALTTLWSFSGGSDGAGPLASLIADEQRGALYGTASGGGASGNGTVFKIDTIERTLTPIWTFSGGSDGAFPQLGALLADETGALYGTASGGGSHGNGTVFKLTPPGPGETAWSETTLYTFCSQPNCGDGATPFAGLIADESGALFGTTSSGGASPSGCFGSGCGTVFKLTPPARDSTAWTLTTLWSFSGGSDGGMPLAPVIADETGALFGTTELGGLGSCFFVGSGCGVVYKLTPPGRGQTAWTQTTLYTFCSQPNCGDGATPLAGLIADESGALFGTAGGGPSFNIPPCGSFGCGVVFKLTGTGFVPADEQ